MADDLHPFQAPKRYPREAGRISPKVTAKAYEVYGALYSGQSLERLNERGGFGTGELIAFLYARNFPREEWHARCDEAMRGLRGLE